MGYRFRICIMACSFGIAAILLSGSALLAGDWNSWRGKYQTGVSDDTGLIGEWSQDGQNLIWKKDFTGRSTPIVMNGRVYVIGRVGEGVTMQEQIACFDARDGRLLWEHRDNVRNTYAPFSRIGWACMVGDPETGNVYSIGTGGILNCFDKDGKLRWTISMSEDYGARTGYGGRTTNPVIDEDRVIVGFVSSGWGGEKPMKGRHFAFNKHSGELVWSAAPGGPFKAPNLYSNPVIAVIDGMRLFIAGNADGNVYALQARTGEKVWEFHLSQRGLNSSVVVNDYRVYAAHSEENIDAPQMGRIVCFDGRGQGDITKSNEIWRYDAEIGYTSPLLHDGRVYYIDNAANMTALDALNGELRWEYSLGTVGKGSPVWADGKIYVTETNGRFFMLEPGETSCKLLDMEEIMMPDQPRHAEIFGSPAIAYGRIYFATEEGLYCLGEKNAKFKAGKAESLVIAPEAPVAKDAAPAHLQVLPAEIVLKPGQSHEFKARAFDDKGRFLREVKAEWSAPANLGSINAGGKLTVAPSKNGTAGLISAKLGEVSGSARVRVFPDLPWEEDFQQYADDSNPPHWIGASSIRSPGGKYVVRTEEDGNKILAKPTAYKGIQRHIIFAGPGDMKNYIVQVDAKVQQYKRKMGDAGLISHGYTLDLAGKRQRLEIRGWDPETRIQASVPFAWETEKWYTIKMDVEYIGDKAVIKGKVWPRGEAEPADWTVTVEDPLPNPCGSPGIYGVSYTEVYYDNFKVMPR